MAIPKKYLSLFIFTMWLLLFPVFVILWYFPVITFFIRLVAWGVGGGIFVGSVYFVRKYKQLLWALAAIYALIGLFVAFSPSSEADSATLRSTYCEALQSYEGRPYIWGGESYSDIDCSGLVRKALEDALTTRGIRTLNAGLIRSALWFYWHDTTAKVIGQGYSGQTLIVSNHLDTSLLKPGDLAVLDPGVHVLAYLGNGIWIEADPTAGRVIKHPFAEDSTTNLTIVRWKVLSD